MHQQNVTTLRQQRGPEPPIIGELKAIFGALPDDKLLSMLKGPRRRGRPGYEPRVLWRCFVTSYALGIESVSALIRYLGNNPYVAAVCGIEHPAQMPSQPTFSRFGTRLSRQRFEVEVRNIQRELTRRLGDTLPDFGHTVAIDGTHMRAWSNGNKRGTRRVSPVKRQRPRPGKVSDADAGWCVKTDTQGRKQFTWGYKAHILCDAKYEIPIAVDVTAGNVHDIKKAAPLLRQIRYSLSHNPKYVLADAGYSSKQLRYLVKRQYRAVPIIMPNPQHAAAVKKHEKIENWRTIYKQRTSVERVNGRMKAFYKLDSIRVRGKLKVMVHLLLSTIVLEAKALAFPNAMRRCVAKAA